MQTNGPSATSVRRVAAVWALYQSTFKNACVMGWTQEQATMELTARLQVISLGHHKAGALGRD